MKSSVRTQNYLPHIDGLRALSIIAVVLYHLRLELFQGGFAGVDVFFVISGYLITSSIIANLKRGRYSASEFYVKRIKRILPAYYAIIAFVLIATPVFYSVTEIKSIVDTALYSIVYAANFYFFSSINYFDLSAQNNPLLHLWSLGVEEQFYIVIPVFMWALWRLRIRKYLPVFVLMFLLSLAVSILAVNTDHSRFAFYMLPTRAWEMLAGAILGQMPKARSGKPFYDVFAGVLSIFGVLLIVISCIFITDGSRFPGVPAIPAVLGSSLVIRYGEIRSRWNILSSSPLVGIGKASYSLYLWHWPIFVFLLNGISTTRTMVALCLTALLTYVSWRFIEVPIRQSKRINGYRAFAMLIICSSVLAGACVFISKQEDRNGSISLEWNGVPTWAFLEKSGNAFHRSPYRGRKLKARMATC